MPKNFETFALRSNLHGNNEELWRTHHDAVLTEHVRDNPGTRPALWWLYDAPRLPIGTFPGCYYDGKLPQPRKRTGGDTGAPAYEVRAVVPSFADGIPDAWVGIDDDDPRTFESQASYLKRHGMLLADEEKRSDFESEEVYSESVLSL
jgi:hypothetical protein